MFELIVKVKNYFNNGGNTALIKITDMDTKECCVVHWNRGHPSAVTRNPRKIKHFDSNVFFVGEVDEGCSQPEPIKLYSNNKHSLSKFEEDITERFKCYTECFSNCSDAANFTLNYFFPRMDNPKKEAIFQGYKCITSPVCLITGGFVPYMASPPLFNAPIDILIKAKLLATRYGESKKIPLLENEKKSTYDSTLESGPKRQSMK
jgi:hypothetical protein